MTLLESRSGGVEVEEAARELGARRRTVYRDFEVLEEAGVPLTSDREGRRARWKVMEGYRNRLRLSLSWSELVGLWVGQQLLGGLSGTVFAEGAASAMEKLRVGLPEGMATRLRGAAGLLSAGGLDGRDYGPKREVVRSLVEAVDGRVTVEGVYRSRGGRVAVRRRRLDPYHLRVAEQGLYLIARCHRSGSAKTFLVDRFDEVRSTGERFEAPEEFRASRFLEHAFGMWSGKPRRVRFVVGPELATLLMERKVHPSQVAQRRADGSVEVELLVAVGPPLIGYLTGLGAAVRSIEPREVREAVVREHRRAAEGLGRAVTRRDTRRG